MKFQCGKWRAERKARKNEKLKNLVAEAMQWHDFYPILPRSVGEHDCRAFETIQRRLVVTTWAYDPDEDRYRWVRTEEPKASFYYGGDVFCHVTYEYRSKDNA